MTDRSDEALQESAHRNLWMHFTRMSPSQPVPIIVRGEGVWVWDSHGKRYLDGLSGLFTSQVGHGRTELAEAAARQAGTLAYFPVWSYAHPTAIELADRLAGLAPGDCNRLFFTTGGSEAVESAWKLIRQYFAVTGQPLRKKVISRNIAYHGATMGALSITGVASSGHPSSHSSPARSRSPTPTSTGPPTSPTISTPSAGGRPTPSSRPSCSRDRRRWPRCSSSRYRTPAAVSLPRRLLPAGPPDLRPLRGAARLRRGHLRLRAAGPLVRGRTLRLPARHRDHGQGVDQRVLPPRGHGGEQ